MSKLDLDNQTKKLLNDGFDPTNGKNNPRKKFKNLSKKQRRRCRRCRRRCRHGYKIYNRNKSAKINTGNTCFLKILKEATRRRVEKYYATIQKYRKLRPKNRRRSYVKQKSTKYRSSF